MPTNNEMLTSAISQSISKMTPADVNLEWERYADLSHNKYYEEMKERIMKKKLKNILTEP